MAESKLQQVTAADIMQRDVVTISREETLSDAMELMTENHVSGLPVVDHGSRCIGLVSVTDILNYEQEHNEEVAEGNAEVHHARSACVLAGQAYAPAGPAYVPA